MSTKLEGFYIQLPDSQTSISSSKMDCCDSLGSTLCIYISVRHIRVHNWKLATIYYLTLLLTLIYVIVYTIILNKGYQERDNVIGFIQTKTKGSGKLAGNSTVLDTYNNLGKQTIFDSIDLIYPSIETNSLFIATSVVYTPNQKQDNCTGNDDSTVCTTDNDCDITKHNAWGTYTGECGINKKCKIQGWCPMENDNIIHKISNVENFTTFVHVDVRFNAFDISRSNTFDRYNTGKPVLGYNLFKINDMVLQATKNELQTTDIAKHGMIILANANWNCNFDLKQGEDDCYPNINFTRIDATHKSVSSGFNFRTADYYYDTINGTHTLFRNLKKLYGIRIVFVVSGHGGRFSIMALSLTLGAGLAYLGLATLLTDVCLRYFVKEKEVYDKSKYEDILTDDETEVKQLIANKSSGNAGTDNIDVDKEDDEL